MELKVPNIVAVFKLADLQLIGHMQDWKTLRHSVSYW